MRERRSLWSRLEAKGALIGMLQTYPNMLLAELAGMCGYDFVILDGEHGVFSELDFINALQILAGVDVLSIVRLLRHDTQAVGRYADMGADAILVPNVTTAEQARRFARSMSYPPIGTRGMGASLHRGTRYGIDIAKHMRSPGEDTALLVLIESARGADNAEEILAVDGVHGAIVGPADLSADLGCPGEFTLSSYSKALQRIEKAAEAAGKPLGTAPHAGSSASELVARGHKLLIVGADMSLMREAMCSQVEEARLSIRETPGP